MGELERRRAANIAENQAMRRHLGLPVEAEAERRTSGSGRARREGERDVATTHRRPAPQSRAGPHGLRSAHTAEGSASRTKLTFARLHARGLYRELDEAVRELGTRLADDVETRLVSLLDDAPSDSKGEYVLVQAFVSSASHM